MFEEQYLSAMAENDTKTMDAIERLNTANPAYYDYSSQTRDKLRAIFGSSYNGCPGIDYTPN